MKLHWIAEGLDVSCARIRFHQMAPWLDELGFTSRVHAFPETFAEYWRLPELVRDADLVLVHKRLPNFVRGVCLKRIEQPIVFDFDDAIFVRQHPKRGSWDSPGRRRRFDRMLALSDAAIAGNSYLAERCRASNLPILVAPSPVPIDVPRVREREPNDVARIGWVGLASNLHFLELLAPAFAELAKRRRFRLVVVSNADFASSACEVENVRWSLDGQEREIARFDVGIMPLELDSPWSKGKCAYKLLQYMAGGVAVVGSKVGMNTDVIEHGVNGFVASSAAEWVDALERLIVDLELRRRFGDAGRELVQREYSYPVQARRWSEFLREVARTSRKRSRLPV